MLLARLVTVRDGNAARDDYSRPAAVMASGTGWLHRLLAAIFLRKRQS
jgi:hypothetical protein